MRLAVDPYYPLRHKQNKEKKRYVSGAIVGGMQGPNKKQARKDELGEAMNETPRRKGMGGRPIEF